MAKTREQMMATLKTKYPKLFVNTTEEFNGTEGGIWMCGEDCDVVDRKGNRIFHYYAESNSYDFGVIYHLNKWANRNGWWFEWNDSGTIMMWPE